MQEFTHRDGKPGLVGLARSDARLFFRKSSVRHLAERKAISPCGCPFAGAWIETRDAMTSARTVKTLAYLVAAMTVVTLVLSLVEPWTVAQTQPASARADELPVAAPILASVPAASWDNLELVLARQDSDKPADLPEAHLIIQADGRVEATSLWRLGHPLPDHLLRVCAVYSGQPSDGLLRCWLKTCDQAAQQIHMSSGQIQLRTVASAGRSPAQARQLRDLQRRLSQMLGN